MSDRPYIRAKQLTVGKIGIFNLHYCYEVDATKASKILPNSEGTEKTHVFEKMEIMALFFQTQHLFFD
ncbi:hypothetical protein [Dolichospermum sp. LEGE 00246]|uniref:hypothetical protein n=1 Tax=Dolichospermum sp. LEGE 00246 TaxID=1828605 RepID=UPI0018816C60|nr:hypothetical protein [Dolichospermum sp. LEGE 00246]